MRKLFVRCEVPAVFWNRSWFQVIVGALLSLTVPILGLNAQDDAAARTTPTEESSAAEEAVKESFDPADITVESGGVQVVHKSFGDQFDKGLLPFSQEKGSKVAIFFSDKAGRLVAFHRKESKLTLFRDDQGGKLMRSGARWTNGFGSFPKISESRKTALIQVEAGGTPKKGSKEILIKGDAVFTVATKTNTVTSEPMPLAKGSKLAAGEFTFEIRAVKEAFAKGDSNEISIRTSSDTVGIAALKFVDGDGKEIESRLVSLFHNGSGRSKTEERVYSLKQKSESLAIELQVWTDREKVTIPFDLRMAVGS